MSTLTKRLTMLAAAGLIIGATAMTASAAPRRIVVVPRVGIGLGFHRTWAYDPFWGPWYPYAYPYAVSVNNDASVKISGPPKDAEIFVDGYYAGRAGDFDGGHHLHVVPGGHTISFFLNGFQTVSEDVYVRPDSTFKLNQAMTRLRPGETSTPVAPPRPNPTD